MKILITGGCKNGKSFYAQELVNKLENTENKFYVATMKPCDKEDIERIKRHKKERISFGFTTIEQPADIYNCMQKCGKNSSVLLDSTTALLSNEMFLEDGRVNQNAHKKITDELLNLCRNVKNIVIVSDYIYSDAQIYDELTEKYRYSLAYIDKALAREFEIVCEVTFGSKIFHKGAAIV